MDDRMVKEYENYKQELFKVGHIKKDSFTLQSFINWIKEDKNKLK
jgi:hypothetical protein